MSVSCLDSSASGEDSVLKFRLRASDAGKSSWNWSTRHSIEVLDELEHVDTFGIGVEWSVGVVLRMEDDQKLCFAKTPRTISETRRLTMEYPSSCLTYLQL